MEIKKNYFDVKKNDHLREGLRLEVIDGFSAGCLKKGKELNSV